MSDILDRLRPWSVRDPTDLDCGGPNEDFILEVMAEIVALRQRVAVLARRAEAGEVVAYHAEEFLDRLEKRWPEVNDMDEWRDALLDAISEMRLLP